jgi:hypothetical protein
MHPLEGHRRDTEAFLIVATKQRLEARAVLGKEQDIPVGEVFRLLLDLLAAEQAGKLLVYEVRAP